MKRIAIVGSGIGGLHLGLHLLASGIPVTIHGERTPSQLRARRLSNVVVRNAPTRERERQLGVNHWDGLAPDLTCLSVSVVGPRPLAFSGALTPPAQVVDMRIYWATLLEDFTARGGELRVAALSPGDVDRISAEYDLTVVAAGRGALANLFPRLAEHSPHTEPQRLVVIGLYRGIRLPEPVGFDVHVSRGYGEILSFPLLSSEADLTAIGIECVRDGGLAPLGRMRYEDDPAAFHAAVLEVLREHAPGVHARIDPGAFGIARPLDAGHVAITPTVRRGSVRLPGGRLALALGDAHVVMDPITGQGANKASHDAFVLGESIRAADVFDEAFCEEVERRICEYAIPVSDACNARLQPPPPHVAQLLGAAAQHQSVADLYALGFHHPDGWWRLISSVERTATLLADLQAGGAASMTPYALDVSGRYARVSAMSFVEPSHRLSRRACSWALALVAVSGLAAIAARQMPAERLPAATLDVTPPSARVRGLPGGMAVEQRPCRTVPLPLVRRRMVDVAVQEWAFFGFRVVDWTDIAAAREQRARETQARATDADAPSGSRRRSRLPPDEAARVAASIAGYWAVTPEGSWIVARQNDEWKGPDGIAARWNAPWSAAFISWVMCEAGLGATGQFQRAIAHHAYIDQAIRARDGRVPQAAFAAYDMGEAPIAPGDLLCSARRPVYRAIADRRRQMGNGARTHCDIVVKVDERRERILVIGGNVRGVVALKLLKAQRPTGKPLRVIDPDEDERPIFAHLRLRAEPIAPDALDTSATLKAAPTAVNLIVGSD